MRCTNSPSRSFGSNHVDFGGMMPPASAMAIRSATLTGYSENATAALPAVDQALEFGGAADAADEIDALVRARVADLQQRLQHALLQHLDVERVAARRAGWRRRQHQSCASCPARNIDTRPGRSGHRPGPA